MDTLKGWRTLIGHGLLAAAGALLAFYDALVAAGIDLTLFVPPQIPTKWAGVILVVISLAFGALRMITNTPVGTHDRDKDH